MKEKKFYIIQWLGNEKYYVKKTYAERIIISSHKIEAKLFEENNANKYLDKLQKIDTYNKLEIRQLI